MPDYDEEDFESFDLDAPTVQSTGRRTNPAILSDDIDDPDDLDDEPRR